ncbi:P-II family nitrogen regulator [Methyloparacoccus murrellii]
MKEIRAYIQPFVLGRVVQALMEIPGFPGMSVWDCEGFGHQRGDSGQDFNPFVAKKRLEILAEEELVDVIIATLMKYAHTGRPGDGRVYLFDVLEEGEIRTGQRAKR